MHANAIRLPHQGRLLRTTACLVLLMLGSCGAPGPRLQQLDLTILHTNDHHGRFWKNRQGEYGLAARRTLIDGIRAEVAAQGGHTLLLDAGDVNTGIPESDMQDAEPDFRGMSLVGYDAMAVGNHEFDKPFATLARQRHEWSSFPWLSANVRRDGQRMFEPYSVFQRGPLRIAVLGLTTEDTAKVLDSRQHPHVDFNAPISEARALLPELRAKADIVVALTHMGHYTDGAHGSNAAGDVELARAVAGIDIIVGGHSQNPVCMLGPNLRDDRYQPGRPCAPDRQHGSWIVQAFEWGKYVGRADFTYRNGELTLRQYRLIPVNLGERSGEQEASIAEDHEMLRLLTPYQQRAARALSAPVGRAIGKFNGDRDSIRKGPTSLGRLVATVIREAGAADVAVISSGGIRDSLPEGELSRRDILTALPFRNTLVAASLSGAQLLAYLRAVSAMTPGSGAYPQWAGVRWERDDILIGGAAVDPAKSYRIATTAFNARGGDGYPPLTASPAASGLPLSDAVTAYIAGRGAIDSADFDVAW